MRPSEGDATVAFSPVFWLASRLFRWGKYRCFVFVVASQNVVLFFCQFLSVVSVLEKDCRLNLRSSRLSAKPLGRSHQLPRVVKRFKKFGKHTNTAVQSGEK